MTTTLITGANKGLGYETARQLAAAGHTVYVGARDPERGRRAAGQLGVRFVQLDVTDDASVTSAAKAIEADGGLDVLVNNAGIGRPGGPRRAGAFLSGSRLPGLQDRGQHGDGAVRQGVPRHQDQRRRPLLHRNRPRRPHRHPDRQAGRRDHRPDGPDRPRRPHRRVLRRQRACHLVAQHPKGAIRHARESAKLAVGWIGLGYQGLPMAAAIAEAGYTLQVWARRPASFQALGDVPHVRHGTAHDLGAACDIIGLCVGTR